MPEYVYALHDFAPEHEDEISFSAGDRIEVIEKDDMYGDGWWQGRNLFGKVGLFPQSYTTSDSSVLQPQPPSQVNGKDTSDAVPAAPVPTLDEKAEVTSVTSGGDKKAEEGGEAYGERNGDGVMKATMTDVQEAIEQLGRNDRDGGGSFSFASTRDGDTTDRELDTDRETDSEAWHKGARSNLAEKARQHQEILRQEQAAYDAEMQLRAPIITAHLSEPPIDFEMSDESEGEGEDDPDDPVHAPAADTLFPHRDHAHISEEEEDEENTVNSQANGHPIVPITADHEPESEPEPEPEPSDSFIVPESDDAEVQPPVTARQVSFPSEADIDAGMATGSELATKKPHSDNGMSNTTQVQSLPQFLPAPLLTPTSPNSLAAAQQSSEKYITSARAAFAPDPDSMGLPHALPSPPTSQNGTLPSQSKAITSPSDWSVEEVVEWAKSKGFDNSVCDKFIEHEITGDVLLELDANILKTELEIHAFGKRTRIAKEIAELRRPPSILSSAPIDHSRTISQSISLPSSAHNSLSSPMATMMSSESPQPVDITASAMDTLRRDSDPSSFLRASEPEQDHHESATLNNSILGLGIGAATNVIGSSTVGSLEGFDLPKGKNRPAYLNLSPSENSLNFRAKSAKFSPKSAVDESIREERAALSDSDSTRALDSRSRRRRIFGRSTGSAHSDQKDTASRHSKEATHDAGTPVSASTSLPGTPSGKRGSAEDASVKTHQRRKRSVDATKSSDRLSLFGGSISIGRSRKPPPRVQSYAHDDLAAEKHPRSLSRLYLSSGSRKASMKSQTGGDDGARRPGSDEKDSLSLANPSVLRKRTTSVADAPALPGLVGGLKAGQSVLEQIGTPDHNGWMRKKGEHYNTWKMRYFVLKGAHLYYLRSSDRLETKIKGYINIIGYKVIVDENVNPGKYGFRLIHETERTHFFSSSEAPTVREWMKALMKATIGRDYTKPVISSCNIPTIPLSVAQTMNPGPRPPSPTQRDATQKALRRENPNQLSTRDARVLMGLPSTQNGSGLENGKARADEQFFALEALPEAQESMPATPSTANANINASAPVSAQPPVRPSRETRRTSVPPVDGPNAPADLIQWANDYLPPNLRIPETGGQIYSGLALYRLAEAIKGKPTEPAVPDSAFPSATDQDRLDGLFKLFDFFLDNDIRMGNVSINDVRQGRRDKIVHLLRALKAWEEKRRAIVRSIGRTVMALEPASATSTHAW